MLPLSNRRPIPPPQKKIYTYFRVTGIGKTYLYNNFNMILCIPDIRGILLQVPFHLRCNLVAISK